MELPGETCAYGCGRKVVPVWYIYPICNHCLDLATIRSQRQEAANATKDKD